ncbi:MAG: peptide deformylase, partial [Kribbellaceae bacterium]|nr:peptide deformylase [Kribbellaceae bacterium]
MSSPVTAHLNQVLASWSPAQLGLAGDVLEVVRAPHPVLATEGAPVDPLDPVMVALAADLVATMRVSPGCVGLAAPQVGIGVQMFALDVTGHPKTRTCHG